MNVVPAAPDKDPLAVAVIVVPAAPDGVTVTDVPVAVAGVPPVIVHAYVAPPTPPENEVVAPAIL